MLAVADKPTRTTMPFAKHFFSSQKFFKMFQYTRSHSSSTIHLTYLKPLHFSFFVSFISIHVEQRCCLWFVLKLKANAQRKEKKLSMRYIITATTSELLLSTIVALFFHFISFSFSSPSNSLPSTQQKKFENNGKKCGPNRMDRIGANQNGNESKKKERKIEMSQLLLRLAFDFSGPYFLSHSLCLVWVSYSTIFRIEPPSPPLATRRCC